MAWVYLDDQFPDHPKVAQAGGDAAWLFVCALCYARRFGTEGVIPKPQVARLSDRRGWRKLADKLVEVGLFEDDGDSYRIHDWHDWNRGAGSRSEAGRKAAQARWDKERKRTDDAPTDASDEQANRNANASESHSDPLSDADASGCTIPSPFPRDDSSTAPPNSSSEGADEPSSGGGGGLSRSERVKRVEQALDVAADRVAARHSPDDPARYRLSIRNRLRRAYGPSLHALAHGGASVDDLASTVSTAEAADIDPGWDNLAPTTCDRCSEMDGWVEFADGSAALCDHQLEGVS